MTESISLPISILSIFIFGLEMKSRLGQADSSIQMIPQGRGVAMAVLQASVLSPNDIHRIEEEARRLLRAKPEKFGTQNDGNQQTLRRQRPQRRRSQALAAQDGY